MRDKKAQLLDRSNTEGIYQSETDKAFRARGVSFNVWHKVDENGYATEKYECTSMMGREKKVLENLPQFFNNFLPLQLIL